MTIKSKKTTFVRQKIILALGWPIYFYYILEKIQSQLNSTYSIPCLGRFIET